MLGLAWGSGVGVRLGFSFRLLCFDLGLALVTIRGAQARGFEQRTRNE
jgi:hypothetical protein